jgi:hypothetical protein
VEALPAPARRVVEAALLLADDSTSASASASATTSAAERVAAVAATEGVTREAAEVVRQALYTADGIQKEDAVREAASASDEPARRIRKDDRFLVSAAPWFSTDDVDVFLGGRLDGFVCASSPDGPGEVVEIKTRQRRFLGVPVYERVQLLAYCFIRGVRTGRLIESYLGERREHAVDFDDALWTSLQHATRAALSRLILCSSPSVEEKTAA